PRRETSKPDETAPGGRARSRFSRPRPCVGASGLRSPEPTSQHAAEAAACPLRRASSTEADRRASDRVRPLRLPPGDGALAPRGLGRQSQARRASLAPGGAESPAETAETEATVARRRIVHAAAPR